MIDKATDIIKEATNGDILLIDGLIELNFIEKEAKEVLDLIKEFKHKFLRELESDSLEHQKKYRGHMIVVNNGKVTYSYKEIKEWEEVSERKKEIEQKYKSAFLSNQKGLTVVDDETGEVLELPTVSYSKSSISVREIKKK